MAVYLGENEVGFNTTYGGIVPSGTYNITENGTYNVTNYESAAVNVVNAKGSASDPVKFIDYDGTILHSYSVSDFMALSTMPSNPSHSGLTSQGWNWSLADAKEYLTDYPKAELIIGQMYITESGDTEIDVKFVDSVKLSPYLRFTVDGTVTVDWGDGSAFDTVTGTSLSSRKSIQHTYSVIGKYTIKIHVVSGSAAMYCDNSGYTLLHANSLSRNANIVYSSCVQAVRLGRATSIGNYAFSYCYSLTSITIPDGITSIESNAFAYCYSLTSITIPDDVTSIGSYAFSNCYSLTSITIPNGVTSIGSYAFSYCSSLTSTTIPDGITSIGGNAFSYCSSLASITIPDGITSIGDYAFYACYSLTSITIPNDVTSIGGNAFAYCYSLASITIPDDVTSIGGNAFASCYGVGEYHILPTTVPTLGTSAFSNIQSDCVMYVPSASLNAYKTAANWSTYASYMVGE